MHHSHWAIGPEPNRWVALTLWLLSHHITMRLSSCCQDHWGLQNLKYWLSGPLQKSGQLLVECFSNEECQAQRDKATYQLSQGHEWRTKEWTPSPSTRLLHTHSFLRLPQTFPPQATPARPGVMPGCAWAPVQVSWDVLSVREKGHWAAPLCGRDICSGDGPDGQDLGVVQPGSPTPLATPNKCLLRWRQW